MLGVILAIPRIISKYFDQFERIFSKKMQAVCICYVTGLLLEHKRFSMQQLAAKAPIHSYQSYQYFLCEAKWDEKELNLQRIRDLNSLKQTKSNKTGVLILDDTSNKKSKNCKKTDSVARQHSNLDEGIVNCQVSVYTCYADLKKAWPVDFKVYWPEKAYFKSKDPNLVFKSKIELGMDLIFEAIQLGINFKYVVYDSWYLSNDMMEFCEDEVRVRFISDLDVDRWVQREGKWYKAGELVTLSADAEKYFCAKCAK